MKGRAEIQAAPDDTARAIQEARHRSLEGRIKDVRLIGDAVIAAFFAEDKPQGREKKRIEVESWLGGSPVAWDKLAAMAASLEARRASAQRRFTGRLSFRRYSRERTTGLMRSSATRRSSGVRASPPPLESRTVYGSKSVIQKALVALTLSLIFSAEPLNLSVHSGLSASSPLRLFDKAIRAKLGSQAILRGRRNSPPRYSALEMARRCCGSGQRRACVGECPVRLFSTSDAVRRISAYLVEGEYDPRQLA